MAERLLRAAWRFNRTLPITVLLLLAINLAGYAWIVYDLTPRMDELERRLVQRQEFAGHSARQLEQARSPQMRFEKTAADLQVFRQAIPERSEFTGLLKELFTLAAESGLSIDRISYDPQQLKDQDLLRYGLVFSVGGEYGQVKKFVYALEQSPRIVAIEEIALTGGSRHDGRGVKLNIKLATYFHMGRR